jgi:HK97 family phage major capsid protein
MSLRERYSLLAALRAAADGTWSQAQYEASRSLHLTSKMQALPFGGRPTSFHVPMDELEVPRAMMKRDATVAGTGGFLVETTNVGFIDLLRNRSVLFRMGAQRMTGLVGNVAIPKLSATGSATWLANESSTINEVDQTLTQVPLSPKTVGAYSEVSRQLLMQSNPSVEAVVVNDLARVVALALDTAGINGSGASGVPAGILDNAYDADRGSVDGTNLDLAKVMEFQADVADKNALSDTCGYVSTPAVAATLTARMKESGTYSPIWEGNILDGTVAGFRAMSSKQMPASHLVFGDFSQLIVAEWGVMSIDVNPYANFQAGIVGVRVMLTCDIGVRHAGAFSVATAVT